MEKIIALFSTDERALYKSDVFASLSLPDDYILHFRYLASHIAPQIREQVKHLKGKTAVIFYASGNDPSAAPEKRKIKSVSVRKVIIYMIEEGMDTGWIHFYLQLKEFADYRIDKNIVKEQLPPFQYVSELPVEQGMKNKWIDRVEEVRDSFGEILFFQLKSIQGDKRKISPVFSDIEKESFYRLREERDYAFEFLFSDSTNGEARFIVDGNSSHLWVNIPQNLKIGARADHRNFTAVTHSLEFRKLLTIIKFSAQGDGGHDIVLRFLIERTRGKSLFFALVSMLGLVAFNFNQVIIKQYEVGGVIDVQGWLISLALFVCSAYHLFHFFNKK